MVGTLIHGSDGLLHGARYARLRHWFWRLVGYALFLALWQFAAFFTPIYVLPPPLEMVRQVGAIASSGLLLSNFFATVKVIVIGFSIAFVLGTAAGIAMGTSRWWEAFLGDWVVGTMNTPGLVFALVAAFIFGLSTVGPIMAVVVVAYPFVVVNVFEGTKAAPQDLTEMARAFGVSRWNIQRHVLLPFLAPYFFTAARYGFSVSWKLATLAETLVGTEGIGFMMREEFQQFNVPAFLAWVLVFFAFALFLERVLQAQSNRFFRWRPEVAQ